MAKYDKEFWDKYADENEARYNVEFAKFVKTLAISLKCSSVLEIGCGTGIDLRLFPDSVKVYGVDLNDKALAIAKQKYEIGEFKIGDITSLPFEDTSVDFVFTHKLLNYLDDTTLKAGVSEMHRVAKKYIMNCELFGESEEKIDKNKKSRNMYQWWQDYKVKIISNVNMHKDIDHDEARFTLMRKL